MRAATHWGFRGGIEGLRGVAVLLVVLDNLEAPGFRAEFLGVDVFFVISGYLITSLLAREYALEAEQPAEAYIGPECQFKLISIVHTLLVSAGPDVGRSRA